MVGVAARNNGWVGGGVLVPLVAVIEILSAFNVSASNVPASTVLASILSGFSLLDQAASVVSTLERVRPAGLLGISPL